MSECSGLSGGHNGMMRSGLPSYQGCQVVKCLRGVSSDRWSKVSEWSGLPGGQKCQSGQGCQVARAAR